MGRPLIVESEIIDSMVKNPSPSRKEVADLQNSIVEGIDVVMLGRETSHGKNPIDSVKALSSILADSERIIDGSKRYQ